MNASPDSRNHHQELEAFNHQEARIAFHHESFMDSLSVGKTRFQVVMALSAFLLLTYICTLTSLVYLAILIDHHNYHAASWALLTGDPQNTECCCYIGPSSDNLTAVFVGRLLSGVNIATIMTYTGVLQIKLYVKNETVLGYKLQWLETSTAVSSGTSTLFILHLRNRLEHWHDKKTLEGIKIFGMTMSLLSGLAVGIYLIMGFMDKSKFGLEGSNYFSATVFSGLCLGTSLFLYFAAQWYQNAVQYVEATRAIDLGNIVTPALEATA